MPALTRRLFALRPAQPAQPSQAMTPQTKLIPFARKLVMQLSSTLIRLSFVQHWRSRSHQFNQPTGSQQINHRRTVSRFWLGALLCCAALLLPAQAQTRRPARASRAASPAAVSEARWQEMHELVRRAQAAAEQAASEAQQARAQVAALQQRYEQTAQELAALRQALPPNATATEQRLAELSSAVRTLQTVAAPTPLTNPAAAAASSATASATSSATAAATAAAISSAANERLAQLEEQVEINSAQIKEHAQTKVETDSKFRLRLYGMVLTNTYLNTADSSQVVAPTHAPAPSTFATVQQRNLGASVRQTTLGLLLEGPRLGAARLSAEAEFDFYGGSYEGYEGSPLGALRLRTASARLDGERTSLIVGLREPLISPLNPSSLAAVWYPALSETGNLWQWRPQAILEHRVPTGAASEWIVQTGVFFPFGESLESVVIEGGPSYQGRTAWRRTLANERALEFGVAGMIGRRSFTLARNVTAYSLNTDWQIPLGERFQLSGEAFFGRSINLSEQSGARADSSFILSGPIGRSTTTIRGLHAAGGWSQLTFLARPDLDFNFAYGQEDPRNRDLFDGLRNPATRFRNQAASANFIYRLRQNFLLSLEFRRHWSDYAAGRRRNDHYNLAVGYSF